MSTKSIRGFVRIYLPALGDGVWFLVLVRAHAEVLDCLTSVPLASQKHRVRPCGRTQRELVQSESLSTSLEDTLLCRLGKAKGGDGQLWDLNETNVISDC